jgi:hypothetical protein
LLSFPGGNRVRHGLCPVDVDGLDKECRSKAGRAHTWELGPLVLLGKEHGHEEPLLPAGCIASPGVQRQNVGACFASSETWK